MSYEQQQHIQRRLAATYRGDFAARDAEDRHWETLQQLRRNEQAGSSGGSGIGTLGALAGGLLYLDYLDNQDPKPPKETIDDIAQQDPWDPRVLMAEGNARRNIAKFRNGIHLFKRAAERRARLTEGWLAEIESYRAIKLAEAHEAALAENETWDMFNGSWGQFFKGMLRKWTQSGAPQS